MAEAKPRPKGMDSPLVTKGMKYGGKAQVWLFRKTHGRVGSNWRVGAGWKKPVPTLLLNHIGRKSGAHFTTPLLYLEDAPNTVVVASQGGMPKHPQWYLNLRANPDVTIEVKGAGAPIRVRARTALPAERDALWPRLVELYADFDSYQSWTEREIPVVILEPHADPSGD